MDPKLFQKLMLAMPILFIMLLACGTSVVPLTPTETASRPQIISTAVPGQQVEVRSLNTDSQGMIIFDDPFLQRRLAVEIKDNEYKQPLQNISVTVISNGAYLLIVAGDLNNKYMPIVKEVDYSAGNIFEQKSGSKLAAPQKQAIFIVATILMKVMAAVQTYQDWMALYNDPPDLDRWGFLSQDYCVNSSQMANGLRAAIDTPLLVVPGPTSSLANLNAPDIYRDLVWLTTLAELNDNLMIDNARDALANFTVSSGAIMKWRVYSISGIPFGMPAVPIGWCLAPLDRTSPDSILTWLKYGFEKNEIFVLDKFIRDERIVFTIVQTGGYGPDPTAWFQDNSLSKTEILNLLSKQLPNHPTCNSYSYSLESQYPYIAIYTFNWPLSDELEFDFRPLNSNSNDFYINSIYYSDPSRPYWYGQIPCP